MRSTSCWLSTFALLAVALGVGDAGAQTTFAGGKNTQATFECKQFDPNDRASFTVTIPKGRKNRLVLLAAHARGVGSVVCDQSLRVRVGPAIPDGFGGSTTGHQGGTDTAIGTWWVDVDAGEAASPGAYVGVAFTVTLDVTKTTGDPCPATCAALVAQMVKK